MTYLMGEHGPNPKPVREEKTPPKKIRAKSKKRQAQHASPEGRAAMRTTAKTYHQWVRTGLTRGRHTLTENQGRAIRSRFALTTATMAGRFHCTETARLGVDATAPTIHLSPPRAPL